MDKKKQCNNTLKKFGYLWTYTAVVVQYYLCNESVLCLGQDFWGTHVSLYLNFRGTFTNTGGHTKSFKFLPVKLNS